MHRAERLLFLELNEVNFRYLEAYIARGELPAFRTFLERHGYSETTSERSYNELEPWIQWVTAHTGMPLADHGVFRLGDIVTRDIPQIWEQLEARGLTVGAISPMNAKNRLKRPAFFVPDPWTSTDVSAPPVFQRLYAAIAQAVNDNARSRLTAKSAIDLAVGGFLAANPKNYGRYAAIMLKAKSRPWFRAMFLDLLLTDLFSLCVKRSQPHFATLFLNAAAHIQHHYMFASAVYDGPLANPGWYLAEGEDPLLDVYRLYDGILADIQQRFPDARLMLATGLHQEPHPAVTYYWRLRDHTKFLSRVGVPFRRVEPRMSRDFLIDCASSENAAVAERRLRMARTSDGTQLFEVDNRGSDLFVMLVYPNDIPDNMGFEIGNERFVSLRNDVAFVAIKNGHHNGIGYFADSGLASGSHASFPLSDIPQRVFGALAL